MVKTIRKTMICRHCKKEIKGKAKLVGLTFICPSCERPCEEVIKKNLGVIQIGSKIGAEMNY